MGFLDTILGRTKPVGANLDALFALPAAALTLEAAESLSPTLQAGVCFKPSVGPAFEGAEQELVSLLRLDDDEGSNEANTVSLEPADQYGYRWVVLGASDFDSLVTRVHFVNSTLHEHGYGPQLLCSVFGFSDNGTTSTYLVYLFKRGTFYPFAPLSGERRDNGAELRLKEAVRGDLQIEPELDRWFPLWGLPVR